MEAPKEYKISEENLQKLNNTILEIPTKYGVALLGFMQTAFVPVEACKCDANKALYDELKAKVEAERDKEFVDMWNQGHLVLMKEAKGNE